MNTRLLAAVFAGVALNASAAGNAGTEPTKVYMVSNAHLDTQWNWDVQTTISTFVRNTLHQNLSLLDKYPGYIFNFEGGIKYSWMKEYYPYEYEIVKKHIRDGRWHISGASWDACDVIVPSVESLIRNIMLGQQFYRDEFGVESTDIFLPDCFGFGWTLPTVAAHCGLIGFSSQKLGWRENPFHGDKKYPFNVGVWQGVDGSEIMMAHGYNYVQAWDIEDLTENRMLKDRSGENSLGAFMQYYGTGDTGGSPTISSVDAVERARCKNGSVEILSVASDQLYKDYLPFSAHPELPRYNGELTMDVHGTGCYTSQAAMKLYNRQNELLGDAAERASATAAALGVATYPGDALSENWRRFIYHQFHDDLTGTSIPRAYEFSWNDELLSLKKFSDIISYGVAAVASQLDTRTKGTPVVLYNALGHECTDVVEIEIPAKYRPSAVKAIAHDGSQANAQVIGWQQGRARILVEATVPANGYAVYDITLSGKGRQLGGDNVRTIENSVYRITFNDSGDVVSLFDKIVGRELVKAGKTIRLAAFTNNNSSRWPAWEVMKTTIDCEPESITGDVRITLAENGPLRSTVLVEKSLGESRFKQYIRLYEGALADRIDFYNEVDWASPHTLVKAEFPLSVDNDVACYDLGLGAVERGNNRPNSYEVYAQRWADLTDRSGDYGVTVMNDCKYGWDKPDNNTIRLTLLHTPGTDRHYPYQDHQDFGYHTFTYSLRGHTGALDRTAACNGADVLNQRVKAFAASRHVGKLGKQFSAMTVDNDALAIKAFKKAEASDEYVIRLYDTSGKGAAGTVSFALPLAAASEADGTEKTITTVPFAGTKLDVSVVPNGVKTYKVRFVPAETVPEGKFMPLSLALDKKCFSWNCFRGAADFHNGYGYAAELIPDTLVVSGVPFDIENRQLLNGKMCIGDTIAVPDGGYDKLYILAAAASDSNPAAGTFTVGRHAMEITVPPYTGFIGQWGHAGHTDGYMFDDEVAFVGTHRHSYQGDHPYEYTYMFRYGIDIPVGARTVVLPDNRDIVIFAATFAKDAFGETPACAPLFRTSIAGNSSKSATRGATARESILRPEHITGWSGYVNSKEKPQFICDGNPDTKWCDVGGIPSYVECDFGTPRSIGGWSLLNAGKETPMYITVSCLLQARNSADEEWRTIDHMVGNSKNVFNKRLVEPVDTRYLRLLVVQPEQAGGAGNTRIYEFGVYE